MGNCAGSAVRTEEDDILLGICAIFCEYRWDVSPVKTREEWMRFKICANCRIFETAGSAVQTGEDGEGSGFVLTGMSAVETGENGESAGFVKLLGMQFGRKRMT